VQKKGKMMALTKHGHILCNLCAAISYSVRSPCWCKPNRAFTLSDLIMSMFSLIRSMGRRRAQEMMRMARSPACRVSPRSVRGYCESPPHTWWSTLTPNTRVFTYAATKRFARGHRLPVESCQRNSVCIPMLMYGEPKIIKVVAIGMRALVYSMAYTM
jgi:hypothetical protein